MLMSFDLDPLQRGIMDMIAAEMSNAEIAAQLTCSKPQGKRYLMEIFKIIGVKKRREAAEIWRKSGLWRGIVKKGI
jgi:DNA-binding CsgD family transcriptional regulator